MARLVSQVVQVVREIIQDRTAPFRYSNPDIFLSITEGYAEARRLRPDFFIDDLLVELPYITAPDFTDAILIPDMYFAAFCGYVAGRTQLRDDEFSSDGRAVLLISTYLAALTGGNRK